MSIRPARGQNPIAHLADRRAAQYIRPNFKVDRTGALLSVVDVRLNELLSGPDPGQTVRMYPDCEVPLSTTQTRGDMLWPALPKVGQEVIMEIPLPASDPAT